MIIINNTKTIEGFRTDWNILAFIAGMMIPVNDRLEGSSEYRQGLKMHCKGVMKESEAIVKKHYEAYENYGNVDNEGNEMHSLNVYTITSRAYDAAFEFFTTRKPAEVVGFVELLRRAEEKGFDLMEMNVEYTPVQV